MAQNDDHFELFAAIASMKTPEETGHLLRDLCTISELDALAHRWQVAQLLDEGLDRKSTRLNSSHERLSRMPSSA